MQGTELSMWHIQIDIRCPATSEPIGTQMVGCELALSRFVSCTYVRRYLLCSIRILRRILKKELKRRRGKRECGNHWETINVLKVFTSILLKRKRVNSEPFLVEKENTEKKHTLWTNVISKYSLLL